MKNQLQVLFLLMFLCLPVSAKEFFTVNGFGFWVDENVFGSEFGDLSFEHVWLICEKYHNHSTRIVMVLSPQGSPNLVHDLRVHKLFPEIPVLEEFIAGKFIPPFSREWSDTRIDQIGTIRYSGFDNSLVARDNGVQLNFQLNNFSASTAIFAGDREGGKEQERNNTHRHFYGRFRYALPYNFVYGMSYRWSTLDRRPIGVEATRKTESSLCAFELLRVERTTQWYLLGEFDVVQKFPSLGRIRLVSRYEKVIPGERTTLGFGFFPFEGLTVKINLIKENFHKQVHKLLTQAIIYF